MKTSYGKLALLALCLLLAALLFAPMRAGEEDSLVLRPSELKMEIGDQYDIKCLLRSDEPNQRVRFASSNSKVASIASTGTIYAIASGEAVITATASGGAVAQARVVVAGVPMSALNLNADEIHIEKGQFSGLKASFNSDASDTRLQWISADETIARVDAAGRIEGVGGGQTFVSVLSPSGLTASAKVYVDVQGTAAHISPNNLTLGVGASVPLKLSYLPLDCTDTVRRWVSSDTKILKIDDQGVLHALSEGTAYVSVITNGGLTTGTEVRVEAAPKDMQLDPTRATLERGASMNMQVMFLNEQGQVDESVSHLVVWSSSNESVAKVDSNGKVTAIKTGTAKITASSDGFTASCHLKVEVTIQEIKLSQQEVYLLKEDTKTPIQLEWVISPLDADDPTVKFKSDNEQVATVSEQGLVSMTGGFGTAVITAYSESGAEAKFVVNVVTQLPNVTPEATEEPQSTGEANVDLDAKFGSSGADEDAQKVDAQTSAAPTQGPTPEPTVVAVG